MSAHLHDLIIAISAGVLVAALLPSVWHQTVVPPTMSAANGVGLFVMAVNLATMRYWYSASTELCDATAWAFLYAVARTAASDAPNARRMRMLLPTATVTAAVTLIATALACGLERQVGSNVHDLVAGATIIGLLAANLPGVYRRTVFPLATCVLIATTIAVLTVNFATMHYWDAMLTELGNLACWAFLLWVAIAARRASTGADSRPAAGVSSPPSTPQSGLAPRSPQASAASR